MARVSVAGGAARALIMDGTAVCEQARALHGASPLAAAALGRALMGALMLGATMKGERELLTLQIKGGGPLGQIVCTVRPGGLVKGFLEHPEAELPLRPDGKLDVGGGVGMQGMLSVVRDEGRGEPYVGRVPLVSGEVAEDIAGYLLASEQTPSLVSLGVLTRAGAVSCAAGVLFAPLPGCPQDVIDELARCAPLLSNVSRALSDLGSLEAFVAYALTGIPHEVLAMEPASFSCDCSRERLERVLLSLGGRELGELAARSEPTRLQCHFCQAAYEFAPNQIAALMQSAGA